MDRESQRLPTASLVSEMQISPALLQEAASIAQASGDPVLRTLIKLGLLSEPRLADALARSAGLPRVASEGVTCDAELLSLFNISFLKRGCAVPLRRTTDAIEIALADPTDQEVLLKR